MWHTLPQQQHRQQAATRPPLIGIDYGGPNTGTVHANRLVLAGTVATPDLVMASNVNDHTDFATSGMDDEGNLLVTDAHGFWFRQTSPRQNAFHDILQQEGLFLFGDQGEATIPPGPFSSEQVVIRENSWYGSDIGRTSLIIGGQVIFVQTGGEDVRGLDWDEAKRKYVAVSLLSKSGAVFDHALDLTYAPSSGREGETVFVIGESGDAAVAVIAADLPFPAWAQWSTGPDDHRLLAATSPRGRTTFLVDRGGEVALETLAGPDEDRLDASWRVEGPVDALPAMPTWMADASGLAYRIHTVDEDGAPITQDVVDLPAELGAGETLEVGLPYERLVETTQFIKRTQQGTSARVRPARILDVAVDFVLADENTPPEESEQIRETLVNIVQYSRRGKPKSLNGRPVRRTTGRIATVRYPARLGWRDRIAIEISSERHVEIAGMAYRATA